MKKWLVIIGAVVLATTVGWVSEAAAQGGGTVTRTAVWDANPPADQVTHYELRVNGVLVGSPTGTSQVFTLTLAGDTVLSLVAVNIWATSAPTVLTVTPNVPSAPSNLRIQQ